MLIPILLTAGALVVGVTVLAVVAVPVGGARLALRLLLFLRHALIFFALLLRFLCLLRKFLQHLRLLLHLLELLLGFPELSELRLRASVVLLLLEPLLERLGPGLVLVLLALPLGLLPLLRRDVRDLLLPLHYVVDAGAETLGTGSLVLDERRVSVLIQIVL